MSVTEPQIQSSITYSGQPTNTMYPGVTQTLNSTTGSGATLTSAVNTTMVRVFATAPCFIAFNTTATTSSLPIGAAKGGAQSPELFFCNLTDRISTVTGTGTATVFITMAIVK